MPSPVIAWLTDFGTRDHYVGAMKGVALQIAGDLTLVDITHEIAPQDVLGGALELAASYRYFPQGTIFVAVVDPGVGSSRRAIAAQAGGYWFVGPDNGVLTLALDDAREATIVELTSPQYARSSISRTFEGRDRFAPAAAWLARGTALTEFGPPVDDAVSLVLGAPHVSDGELVGEVLRIDRFGNAVTNIPRALLDAWLGWDRYAVTVGQARVDRIASTYADVPDGSLCAIFSSSNHLELRSATG